MTNILCHDIVMKAHLLYVQLGGIGAAHAASAAALAAAAASGPTAAELLPAGASAEALVASPCLKVWLAAMKDFTEAATWLLTRLCFTKTSSMKERVNAL